MAFHEVRRHPFLAGLLEFDGQFITIDFDDATIAELLVKNALTGHEVRFDGGRGDKLPFNGTRPTWPPLLRLLIEFSAGLFLPALSPLPARRLVI